MQLQSLSDTKSTRQMACVMYGLSWVYNIVTVASGFLCSWSFKKLPALFCLFAHKTSVFRPILRASNLSVSHNGAKQPIFHTNQEVFPVT